MSWRRFFRRARRDDEVAAEIAQYVAQETDDNLARGMSADPDCTAENPSSSCMKSGSRKVIDIRIANIMAPMSVPDRKTLSLNSDRST